MKYSFYVIHKVGKGTYVDSADLEQKVEVLFDSIQISKEYVKYVQDTAERIIKENRDQSSTEKGVIAKDIFKYQKALKDIEDERFIGNTIDNDRFISAYERYENKLKELEEQLANLNKDYSDRVKQLNDILSLAQNIGKAYRKAKPEIKRRYLGIFFKKIIVDTNTKEIAGYELKDDVAELIKQGKVQIESHWGG